MTALLKQGLIFGILAAASQSLSYLFSRWFVQRCAAPVWRLLILAHVWMGLACLALAPWVLPRPLPPTGTWIGPLLGATGAYLLGQAGLFMLMRRVEASRVAPLLGIKILILSLIAVVCLHERLALGQWAAVALSAGAALILSRSGGTLSPRALAWILFTSTGYSISDLFIQRLVAAFAPLPIWRAAMIGAVLCYLLSGLLVLPGVPWLCRSGGWRDAPAALPFAAAWLLGMLFLFGCFGSIGAVFGNVLQSTRGLMSIVLGTMLARAGWVQLEPPVSRSVLGRRLAAALMMVMAVWLFARARG